MATTWGCEETACVATANGTVAIAAPLIAAGVTGRVILPAFTFPATLSAVRMAGAEPLLIDNASGLGVVSHPVERSPHSFEAYSLHATKPFAVGLAVARDFATRLERRRALAGRYMAALASFGDVVSSATDPNDGAWQSFPLLLPNSDTARRFIEAARARGMEARQYYVPVYADATDSEAAEMVAIFNAALSAP